MPLRITSFETSELHDYITDAIAPNPVKEIPSNWKGYRCFLQGGQLLVPAVMANVAIFRQTYMEDVHRQRSKISKWFRVSPSMFESLMIIDLQEPAKSIDIRMYPDDPERQIRVVAGDFTENKDTYTVRDQTAADLIRVNQVIEALDVMVEW